MSKNACTIAGPTLSALLRSASIPPDNGEGFLIGSLLHRTGTEVHDRQEGREWARVDVSFQTFWRYDGFYSVDGTLNPVFIDAVKGKLEGEQRVVGWYKCRKYTSSRPSLREAQVHRNLVSLAKTDDKLFTSPENFVFLIITGDSESNGSVQTQNYRSITIESDHVSALPIRIPNLLHGTQQEHKAFRTGVSGVNMMAVVSLPVSNMEEVVEDRLAAIERIPQ